MATDKDKKLNTSLNQNEAEIISEYKHHFMKMIMLFYQLDCKQVLEVPFTQDDQKFKVRIEKIND